MRMCQKRPIIRQKRPTNTNIPSSLRHALPELRCAHVSKEICTYGKRDLRIYPNGKKRPELGQKRPELGQKRPKLGQKRPELGQKRPELGQKRPELGQKRPKLGQRRPTDTLAHLRYA